MWLFTQKPLQLAYNYTTCVNCTIDGFKHLLIKKVNIYQYTYHTSVFQLLFLKLLEQKRVWIIRTEHVI